MADDNVVGLNDRPGEPPRQPPHNIEAEQGLLGSILLNNAAYDRVAGVVSPEHFFDPVHGDIFRVIGEVIEAGGQADHKTLQPVLLPKLKEVAAPDYLGQLVISVPNVINAPHYAERVRDFFQARMMIEAGQDLIEAAHSGSLGQDLSRLAGESLSRIESVSIGTDGGLKHYWGALIHAVDNTQAARESGGMSAGVPTGLVDLDRHMGGLVRGELTIAAGRPGMGKTGFAGTIATNVAKTGIPVAFFSLEMQAHYIANRMIAAESGIDGDLARRGELDDAEFERYRAAADRIRDLPIHIDDASVLTIEMIAARARAHHRRGKCGLVMIDYLGLIEPSDRRERNRAYQIEHVTKAAKRLAKQLDVPVLMLAQIGRVVESRDDKRPTQSDLRDCLPGDALVLNADTGARVPISEIVTSKLRFNVWAVTADYTLVRAPIAGAWPAGEQTVREVTTRSGRRIRCTGGHRFLTAQGWRRLDEMCVGAEIAVPREYQEPTLLSPISQSRALLLGWLIGDAYLGGSAALTVAGPPEAEIAAGIARREFGLKPAIKPEHSKTDALKVVMTTGAMTGAGTNPLTAWLREIGAWGKRGAEKRVPEIMFSQPAPVIRAFLRGLFHADGTCTRRAGQSRVSVKLCTISEQLARDVQHLLLRVGITANLRRDNHRASGFRTKHRWIWTVWIGERALVCKFIDEIGFIGRKHTAAAQKLDREKLNDAGSMDRLPSAVNEHIDQRRLSEGLSHGVIGWRQQGKRMSRSTAAFVAERIDDPWLETLSRSDVLWDEIIAVDDVGAEPVFDLTVSGPHSFCVDDFVTHNSGAIEQDAADIIFLYRHEYYLARKEPEDVEERADWDAEMAKCRNRCELILAKRRHGEANKTVTLYFDGKTSRFGDFAMDGGGYE